jgi:hypothetical protein
MLPAAFPESGCAGIAPLERLRDNAAVSLKAKEPL